MPDGVLLGQAHHQGVLGPVVSQGAAATEKLDAGLGAAPFDAGDLDQSDLAGGPDVGPATGRAVELGDLYDAHGALVDQRLAQRQARQLVIGHKASRHGLVLKHHPVGQRLHGVQVAVYQRRLVQIDGGVQVREVEADGIGADMLQERRRQDVLAGVLLHQIKAPVPVDPPLHLTGVQG